MVLAHMCVLAFERTAAVLHSQALRRRTALVSKLRLPHPCSRTGFGLMAGGADHPSDDESLALAAAKALREKGHTAAAAKLIRRKLKASAEGQFLRDMNKDPVEC